MSLLSDHATAVNLVLGNRTDLNNPLGPFPTRVQGWIRDSYINLTMRYPFDTLEFELDTAIVGGLDGTLPYPDDCRAVRAITFFRNDGTTFQPEIKDMMYMRQVSTNRAPGPPSVVAFSNRTMFFRPIPDQQYNIIIDYWQLPQFIDVSYNLLDPYATTEDIGPTPILLPNDWIEILELGAELRGHIALLERDKAQEIQQLLYGVSLPQGKMVPGLIAQALTRRQAQAPKMDYGLQPRVARQVYTNVS